MRVGLALIVWMGAVMPTLAQVPPGVANRPRPRPNPELLTTRVKMTLQIARIDPTPPVAGGTLTVQFTLSNPTQSALAGRVSATLQGHPLVTTNPALTEKINLAGGQTISGSFTSAPLESGSQELQLFFTDSTDCSWHVGAPKPTCRRWDGESTEVLVDPDDDKDGLSDTVERALLAKFTPFFRFSKDGGDEDYRPADLLDYVKASELQNDGDEGKGVIVANSVLAMHPEALLSAGTNVTVDDYAHHGLHQDRFLNPIGDAPRHGASWADVLSARNIGLFGHVVPFQNTPPHPGFASCPSRTDGQERPGCQLDPKKSYFKIEYWQFFGYNDTGQAFDLGDHESDWCTVQVFVDSANGEIAEVDMFFHGRKVGYVRNRTNELPPANLEGDQILQLAYGPIGELSFTWNQGPVADTQNETSGVLSQNRVVRLFRDPTSGEYVHPVVYVEHGGHEFWPTEHWSFAQAPKHTGDDIAHSYLAAPPPNLGEVEHPLAESPAASLVLQYNGYWGAFNHRNTPPQGPALHAQWQLPSAGRTFDVVQDGY